MTIRKVAYFNPGKTLLNEIRDECYGRKVLLVDMNPRRRMSFAFSKYYEISLYNVLELIIDKVDPDIGFYGSLDKKLKIVANGPTIISGNSDMYRLERLIYQEMPHAHQKNYTNRLKSLIDYAQQKDFEEVVFFCDNSYSITNQLVFAICDQGIFDDGFKSREVDEFEALSSHNFK